MKNLGLAASLFGLVTVASGAEEGLTQQGEYVFKLAGCQACHTDTKNKGAFLAGGRALATPFGTFYTPNLTPDPTHGLGHWREEEFARALHFGISQCGLTYFPVFPYPSYTNMHRDDIHALWAYLRTVSPVEKSNSPHDIPWYLGWLTSWVWQWLFFSPEPEITNEPEAIKSFTKEAQSVQRGQYIATALAHCQECHTPRTPFGTLQKGMAYAGTKEGPEGAKVPNITSDKKTGIGEWSHTDLVDFFKEGSLPNGDYTGGLMAEVVENGLKFLTPQDAEALANYIATLPAISNSIRKTSSP